MYSAAGSSSFKLSAGASCWVMCAGSAANEPALDASDTVDTATLVHSVSSTAVLAM